MTTASGKYGNVELISDSDLCTLSELDLRSNLAFDGLRTIACISCSVAGTIVATKSGASHSEYRCVVEVL